MSPPTVASLDLTGARETAFEAFDEAWSSEHNRKRASFEGARQTFWWAAFTAALDYVVANRTDIDQLRAERDALEDHVSVEGDCRRQMFLGDCAECEQYHRLDARIMALESAH